MGKKALLIGHGMQGKAVLYDLVNHSDVSQIDVIDNQPGALDDLSQYPKGRVRGRVLDARDGKSLSSILRGVDVVIETLPGAFALPVGRLAAEKGVHLVSSMYFLNPGERDIQKIQSMKKQILEIDQKAK
jgi:lysine 6-dehydrogenase